MEADVDRVINLSDAANGQDAPDGEPLNRPLWDGRYERMTYVKPSKDIQGWMGDEELDWLYKQAHRMDTVIEIGCWKGRSTHALLRGCPGTVYAVDHFLGTPNERSNVHKEATERDIFPEFVANTFGIGNLVILKMESSEAAKAIGRDVDMVFIDGDHSYEGLKADIEAWRPLCRKLLCGHDISYQSVRTVLEDLKIPYRIVEPMGTLWAVEV